MGFKIVNFYKYCNECLYKRVNPDDDPCNECLDAPVNEESYKPINFKEKRGGCKK